MKQKRFIGMLLSIAIAFVMVFSGGEKSGFFNTSITAKAEGSLKLDSSSGILYLKGEITTAQLRSYGRKEAVSRIRITPDVEGCKLPADCSHMFNSDDRNLWPNLVEINLSGADASQVRNMEGMFAGCDTVTFIRISDVSGANQMSNMFLNCASLEKADLLRVTTTSVMNMSSMFAGCCALKSLDLSSFDTSLVFGMKRMFMGCTELTDLRFPSTFKTDRVNDMSYMFAYCNKLSSLDLSSFNTSIVTDMEGMFSGCSKLNSIYVSDKWTTRNVSSSDDMFIGCTNIRGGNGTTYNNSFVNAAYARVDRSGQAGYLTGNEDNPYTPEPGTDPTLPHNFGICTIDLTGKEANISNKAKAGIIANTLDGADYGGTIATLGNDSWENGAALDLDMNGTGDIYILPERSITDFQIEALDIIVLGTNSVNGNILVSLTSGAKGWLERKGSNYYSGLRFVFNTTSPTVSPQTVNVAPTAERKVGDEITVDGVSYTITSAEADKYEVRFNKPLDAKVKIATIPDSISIDGREYKVTEIKANAFKGNRKLVKATIGRNIVKIGNKAFFKCSKLKYVKIMTPLLTKKNVGKAAFKDIHAKAKVKVPKKSLKSYQKLLKAKEISGKEQKITKL